MDQAAKQRYRCTHCGNRTRFDVYDTVRRRRFLHYTLGGEVAVDEEDVISQDVERVVCHWCDRDADVEALGDES